MADGGGERRKRALRSPRLAWLARAVAAPCALGTERVPKQYRKQIFSLHNLNVMEQ